MGTSAPRVIIKKYAEVVLSHATTIVTPGRIYCPTLDASIILADPTAPYAIEPGSSICVIINGPGGPTIPVVPVIPVAPVFTAVPGIP